MIFRRIFARTVTDEATNVRESIRRDNMRALFADPHYIRGEHLSEFERAQRRQHVLPAKEVSA